ncbi:uncharacterized protein LOC130296828 isoform X2 [Hyla sarda]|uniref:uncharacterized protein LOC130296828 isoform X2 n=1 Tax=Hyla sarda TaxID=327740 RepID=UPI0024C2EF73|nr:uncharacterized protein LOC130296828 isoform X2 [Hyla sarda]
MTIVTCDVKSLYTSIRHNDGINAVKLFLRMSDIDPEVDELFEKRARELSQRFRERGYDENAIQRAYYRAKSTNRNVLLQTRPRDNKDNQVRFITTFHSQAQDVRNVLAKYWDLLTLDPILGLYIQKFPSLTYRRSTNLRDKLVHSHYSGPQTSNIFGSSNPRSGCKSCGRFVACQNVVDDTSFLDSSGNIYRITHNITCNTVGIIYHATCPCGLIYVGMTTREFKRRIREHVLGILAAANQEDISCLTVIPRHFKIHHDCNPSGLRFRGIDRIFISQRGVYQVREPIWE